MRALIKACSNRAPTGIRNRALLVALYRGGLRVSEALGLHPKDLDRAAGTVTVLRGKGGKRRTIGLDAGAFAVVERWLDVRAKRGINGRAPIFCTLRGKPVAPAYVRGLCKRLVRRARIEKRVHPHAFRHTHAAELAHDGLPMNLIQAQLGHSSLLPPRPPRRVRLPAHRRPHGRARAGEIRVLLPRLHAPPALADRQGRHAGRRQGRARRPPPRAPPTRSGARSAR